MSAQPSLDELVDYMRHRLQHDEQLRQELTTAMARKDAGAAARIARGILKGLQAVAPYLIPVVLAMFGIYIP